MAVVTGHTCNPSGFAGSRPIEERQARCPACCRQKKREQEQMQADLMPIRTRGDLHGEAIAAASVADWGQVISNGGPPCFHLENGRFCLRAQRWEGHGTHGRDHKFVNLADLIASLAGDAQEGKA